MYCNRTSPCQVYHANWYGNASLPVLSQKYPPLRRPVPVPPLLVNDEIHTKERCFHAIFYFIKTLDDSKTFWTTQFPLSNFLPISSYYIIYPPRLALPSEKYHSSYILHISYSTGWFYPCISGLTSVLVCLRVRVLLHTLCFHIVVDE